MTDKVDESASVTQPKAFTPKIMHAPTFQEEGETRKVAARPKVNRMPTGLLESSRASMKALEGPKAAADSESMLPPLDLKKNRTLDWKFTLAIVALVIIINAIIGMTLGKNNPTTTPAGEATSSHGERTTMPQEKAILEAPATTPSASTVPAPADGMIVAEPSTGGTPAPEAAPVAPSESGASPTSQDGNGGSQDLMSIINRY